MGQKLVVHPPLLPISGFTWRETRTCQAQALGVDWEDLGTGTWCPVSSWHEHLSSVTSTNGDNNSFCLFFALLGDGILFT